MMGVLADKVEEGAVPKRLERLASMLDESGIELEDIGAVRRVAVKDYQGFYKDADGVAHTVDMKGTSLVFDPSWAEGPKWPVVQQAKPVVVKPPKARKRAGGRKRAMILPDPQIGYRMFPDGTLDPFHDESAMDVALQVTEEVQPDVIVNLGDTMDFPMFGKYDQEPTFSHTTQPTLDRTHAFLGAQKAICDDVHVMEGNHDRRLQNWIIKNALAAFGLRQANAPDSWPVMSVQHLLRLDELGVTYHDGYPAAEFWINDNLVCIHGSKVRSGGSTAAAYIDDERVSILFGHVHRIEMQHKTRRTRSGRKQNFAATPGCLARTDGAVPSTKGSTDALGRPIPTAENWQQGIAIVEYEEGDGAFDLDIRPIIDGELYYRGNTYTSTVDVYGNAI